MTKYVNLEDDGAPHNHHDFDSTMFNSHHDFSDDLKNLPNINCNSKCLSYGSQNDTTTARTFLATGMKTMDLYLQSQYPIGKNIHMDYYQPQPKNIQFTTYFSNGDSSKDEVRQSTMSNQ
mmetsp:Transcript_28596/g.27592  ORF Transcript_28596/g.27592 Transcript_28596/m.27592 type:complete len:120 (-) Transcript_28596:51-410(-)